MTGKQISRKALLALAGLASVVVAWVVIRALAGTTGQRLIPAPRDVLEIAVSPELYVHAIASVGRMAIGLVAGYATGLAIGVAISSVPGLRCGGHLLELLVSVPGIAWAPLFVMAIGFGSRPIVLTAAISAVFPAAYAVVQGVVSVPASLQRLSSVLGLSLGDRLRNVTVPASVPFLISALRLALARAWRTVVAVEMIAATQRGLGYFIFDARELLRVDEMFAGILLSGVVFVILEKLVVTPLTMATTERWGLA